MDEASALTSNNATAERLTAVLRRARHIMEALRVARAVDAPDWLICAGTIRDAVWDDQHDRPLTTMPRDVDVAFFDAARPTPDRDDEVEEQLRALAPQLPWHAKNQAAVHLWYPSRFGIEVAPLRSTAEGVATFPETASCVGVRLLTDDDMLVVAPHGLDDLFGCVCRHNPTRVPAGVYEQRVEEKGGRNRWPNMRYVPTRGVSWSKPA
jgi:hypothetical protein